MVGFFWGGARNIDQPPHGPNARSHVGLRRVQPISTRRKYPRKPNLDDETSTANNGEISTPVALTVRTLGGLL